MYQLFFRKSSRAIAARLFAAIALFAACNDTNNAAAPTDSDADRVSSPPIVWGPAPEIFPAGAQMAVVQGDPGKTEPFTVRLRLPNGYVLPAHTHPTDENVTVISGTFKVGMGAAFDESQMISLPAGGFVTAPAQHAHFAKAVGQTTVQVNAIGPFALTYVNPNDAPHSVSR